MSTQQTVSAVDLTLRSCKEECLCPRVFQLAASIAEGVKGMVDYLAGTMRELELLSAALRA